MGYCVMPYTPVSQLNELYPTDCPHLLAVRAEYATWNWYTEHGYLRYSRGDMKSPYEHQMVAERAFGPIPRGHHVHHLDEEKTSNSASNLRIVRASEHAFTHKFTLMLVCVCPVCGGRFERTLGQSKRPQDSFYCSRQCKDLADRRVKRPSRDELGQLLSEIGNWSAIGRMFAVSDNAVRKWAKAYDLID